MAATLNNYVWDLYLNTFEGQQALTYFQTLDNFADRTNLFGKFMGVGGWIASQTIEGGVWEEKRANSISGRENCMKRSRR